MASYWYWLSRLIGLAVAVAIFVTIFGLLYRSDRKRSDRP